MIKDMHVLEINLSIARPFIEKWHYSGRVPTGKNIFFAWTLPGEDIYAVANYGIGVNPYQESFLSKVLGADIFKGQLLELKRLCRTEPRIDTLQLTAFISRCHKRLKTRGYRYIVSFSDPEHGHSGGIYKAANFTHVGQTNPEWHLVDKGGTKRHRRYAYRFAKRNNVSTPVAREMLGVKRVKTLPKDRWVIKI